MPRPMPVVVHLKKSEVKWLENWLLQEDTKPTGDEDIKMANSILNQIDSDYTINPHS